MPIRTTNPRTGKRYYEWRGKRYWSVTTIIGGGLPAPALINWAKKYTAEYAVDNLEKLMALCQKDEDGRWDRQGAIDWLKGAAYRDRDQKGALGTLFHEAVEAYVLEKPYPRWDESIKPRMDGFVRFLEEYQPDFYPGMVEAPVFNKTERYAGTLDAIFLLGAPSKALVCDWKTGGKGIYPKAALQLAAYRNAEFIGAPDGSEVEMPKTDGAVALHLPESGEYELVEVQSDEEVYRAFLFVREVFRFQEELSKKVILGPYPSTLESAGLSREEGPWPTSASSSETTEP